MRVVITGGAGFAGRATVRAAVEAGHQIRVVSRDAWPSGSMPSACITNGNRRAMRASGGAMASERIEKAVHLASTGV